MNKGLYIDQKIRIPLSDTNFTQKGNKGTPVYYKAGEKDDLARVSKLNRDVSLDDLRFWNGLQNDELKKGQKLVIGFLVTNEMASITIPVSKPEPAITKKEVKEEKAALKEEKEELKAAEEEQRKKEDEERKKAEEKNIIPAVEKKEVTAVIPRNEGYFKSSFESQVRLYAVTRNETVTAGIFKTASGWQDGKYYILIDGVSPGIIVKITNPTNNRVVYAKVLGAMSGIRQNEGLTIRMSNAAAASLEITEPDKFIVKLSY